MCDRLNNNFFRKNKSFSLMKKTNQFENEITEKINNATNWIPTSYGDRFIPRRFSAKNCERNLKLGSKTSPKDVLSLCSRKYYWRENNYLPTLNSIMDMKQDRIINLMDPVVKSVRTHCQRNTFLYDWPCRPRSKPYASVDSTFDLPDHGATCEPNLVDWSTRGHIAVSFNHEIIIWQSKEDVTMAFDIKCPRSLAYSPNGNFLAIGCKSCDYPVLELWDVSRSQDFCVICGKVFNLKHVAIQCVQWTPSGKQIVCGTYYGFVYVLSAPDMNTVKKVQGHNLPITLIRFSPTMRYLASADSAGNIVVYNWNICSVYLYVRSTGVLNVVFDWHPWTGVDLAISESASIVILHVPSKKIVAAYQQNKLKIIINYISFSKLTGELLVSISNQDRNGCSDYRVLVMSSLDRIVDILKIPDGGARFLMWSPDGKTVATTNNDEDLSLWNFCSLHKTKYFKKLNGSKTKSSLDSKFGNQFRNWYFFK